jgi:hypothetical protein
MIIFKELDKNLEITDIKKGSISLVNAKNLYGQFTTKKNILHLFYFGAYNFNLINKEFDFTEYDRVILDFSGADDFLLRFCDIDIVKSKLKAKEVFVISKNIFEKFGYIYNDPIMHRIKILDYKFEKKEFQKPFFFLGGHARWHRLIFLNKLLKLNKLSELNWSLRRVEEEDKNLWKSCIPLEYINVYKSLDIHSLLPKSLDFDIHDQAAYHNWGDASIFDNPGYVANLKFYQNSCLEIISESVYEFAINPAKKDNEYFIVSEKTFKPLALGFPFIGLTLPKTFNKIKEWGFELFDELVDYSFDSEYDDEKRMNLIIEQIDSEKIKRNFISNFDTIYKKHIHNRNMFLELKKRCLQNYEKIIS